MKFSNLATMMGGPCWAMGEARAGWSKRRQKEQKRPLSLVETELETEMRLLCWRHGHGHEKEFVCKILGFLSAPSLTTICTDPHTQQFHLLSPSLTS